MYRIFILLMFIGINTVRAQEKFLEVTVAPMTLEGESLKKFTVTVTTSEEITFEIRSKRKKTTFYLPAGESYKLKVIKEGYYKNHIEIDLTEVPESIQNSSSETLEHTTKLIPSSEPQQAIVRKFKYEPRYGKVIRLVDEE